MRKLLLASAALILALGFGTQAQAGQITVTYGFNTPIIALGAVPIGSVQGAMNVTYQGPSINSITGGPVLVSGVFTGGTISVTSGLLSAVGCIGCNLTGVISGVGFGGAGSLVGSALNAVIGAGGWTGMVHCFGTLCTAAMGLPNSVTVPAGAPMTGQALAATVLGLPTGTGFNFSLGMGTLTIGAIPASLAAVGAGTELARSFLPEPATGSLLALGLVALAVAGRKRR